MAAVDSTVRFRPVWPTILAKNNGTCPFGAGIKKGHILGETDDFSYNIVKDPVHIHDLNATALHLLGLDHTRLTYRFQGRDYRLTDVHGEIVKGMLT
jgi:hypothetical protein